MTKFSFSVQPPEIHLKNAPILRTLCQIRHSSVPEMVDDENEKKIAEELKTLYPVRGVVQGIAVPLVSEDTRRIPEVFRTFEDEESVWKVTVAPEFIALETFGYGRRKNFVERIGQLIQAISNVKKLPRVERIGIRYTNRIENPQGLLSQVHPEFLGWVPVLEDNEDIQHQVIQTLLNNHGQGSKVLVQSFLLPPKAVLDTGIDPSPEKSWVLDIDSYIERRLPFDRDLLVNFVENLSKDAYKVFHRTMKDEFRSSHNE